MTNARKSFVFSKRDAKISTQLGQDASPPTRWCATARRIRCASDTMLHRQLANAPQSAAAAAHRKRCRAADSPTRERYTVFHQSWEYRFPSVMVIGHSNCHFNGFHQSQESVTVTSILHGNRHLSRWPPFPPSVAGIGHGNCTTDGVRLMMTLI